MDGYSFWGILSLGFVFGYLLYYSVRHTKEFSIDLLSSAIGAIGGGVVVGTLSGTPGWIGPYGIGIGAGFLFYLALTLLLANSEKLGVADKTKVTLVSQALIGAPAQE